MLSIFFIFSLYKGFCHRTASALFLFPLKAFLVVSLHVPHYYRVRIISKRYVIMSTSNVPDSGSGYLGLYK